MPKRFIPTLIQVRVNAPAGKENLVEVSLAKKLLIHTPIISIT